MINQYWYVIRWLSAHQSWVTKIWGRYILMFSVLSSESPHMLNASPSNQNQSLWPQILVPSLSWQLTTPVYSIVIKEFLCSFAIWPLCVRLTKTKALSFSKKCQKSLKDPSHKPVGKTVQSNIAIFHERWLQSVNCQPNRWLLSEHLTDHLWR